MQSYTSLQSILAGEKTGLLDYNTFDVREPQLFRPKREIVVSEENRLGRDFDKAVGVEDACAHSCQGPLCCGVTISKQVLPERPGGERKHCTHWREHTRHLPAHWRRTAPSQTGKL